MVFMIYINYLHNSLESEPRLFADETCLLVKGSNSEQLEINFNAELHYLHLWCSVNKRSVNLAKTNIVIISPKRNTVAISHFNTSSNGTPVNIVSSAKYLEVMTDNEFNFHEQIKITEGKVARSVGILNKPKQTLPQAVMLQRYYVLVHPLLLMESHVSSLFTETKIPTKSSDKSHCWYSFSKFSKPILLTIENSAN